MTTIEHFGVTWTFAGTVVHGTFANGEPWVVGPCSCTAVDLPPHQFPDTNTLAGGMMLNPMPLGDQGYAPHIPVGYEFAYDADLDVSLQLPLSLVAGDALVATRTRFTASEPGKNSIYVLVGLVVLASAPAAGSFRPGLLGTSGRTVTKNLSDANQSLLPNLSPTPIVSLPPVEEMESDGRNAALPWWEIGFSGGATTIRPWINYGSLGNGNTGQFWSGPLSHAALSLCLSGYSEAVLIQNLQRGIDISNYISNGGHFWIQGSQHIGAGFPLILAAFLFNDATMIAQCQAQAHFIEGQYSTFFVDDPDIGRVVGAAGGNTASADAETYTEEMRGTAEWGIQHQFYPWKDDSRWEARYRGMWSNIVGWVMAVRLMGAESVWGWLPTFAYNERHMTVNGLAGMELEMKEYYDLLPPLNAQSPAFSPDVTTLEVGSLVSLTAAAGLTIYYTTNGTDPTDASTEYTGPITLSSTVTIKAIAYSSVDGQSPSTIVSKTITVASTPAPVSNFTVRQYSPT